MLQTTPTTLRIGDAKVGQGFAQAQRDFFAFRRLICPKMVCGSRCCAWSRSAIMAPPQHGKSWAATDFIAWVAERDPDLKTIFASHSADLGIRTNLDVQRRPLT